MIITWLCGGLGNQMFQYAAGLALAERRRTVLKLDVSWYREDPAHAAHNRYALSAWNIVEQFATGAEIAAARGEVATRSERWLRGAARGLRLYRLAARLDQPGRPYHVAAPAGDPAGLAACPDGTHLSGMWQAEEHFEAIAPLLRQQFTPRAPLSAAAQACAARIAAARGSIAVHLRRGDYVQNPTFARELGAIGPAYYAAALARVRAAAPGATLFVFSDDPLAAARELPAGPDCVHYQGASPWHAHEEMLLMAGCDHAIIGNSTFAWWGAWLHAGAAANRLVIAPEPWFADPAIKGGAIVPKNWIRLPRAP
jgi:hypothetical protein